MSSALNGVIADLRAGRPLSTDAIDELEALLDCLSDEGWSGFTTADAALMTLIRPRGGT